ncbi:MAG: ABC transporter ATP-binding protein [Erysipelotrichales bacterium]
MSDNAIEVKNLSKTFRYFEKDYKVFQWLFTGKGYTKEFKVLRDISFEVPKGEIVGILGKNGAGKSTILKIISGIYFPSKGEVKVDGSIASLIELGAGFNKELTGRENIYFKGSLLGLTTEYIDGKIDDIISFADIGDYIDMPMGTYSSGMGARLGFALAVNADPEILIIDEVFAVGDKNFQKKSKEKTVELLSSGKTVLFVSHSEGLIKEFCSRVIYLKDGKIAYDGDVDKGLTIYHGDNLKLPRRPMMKMMDVSIDAEELILRFEYGISIDNRVVANDSLSFYSFYVAQYDKGEGQLINEDVIAVNVEDISPYVIDLRVPLNDVVDSGDISAGFSYKTSEEIAIAKYLELDTTVEEEDYIIKIKSSRDNFVLNVKKNYGSD